MPKPPFMYHRFRPGRPGPGPHHRLALAPGPAHTRPLPIPQENGENLVEEQGRKVRETLDETMKVFKEEMRRMKNIQEFLAPLLKLGKEEEPPFGGQVKSP